jgi:hypothetical protein
MKRPVTYKLFIRVIMPRWRRRSHRKIWRPGVAPVSTYSPEQISRPGTRPVIARLRKNCLSGSVDERVRQLHFFEPLCIPITIFNSSSTTWSAGSTGLSPVNQTFEPRQSKDNGVCRHQRLLSHFSCRLSRRLSLLSYRRRRLRHRLRHLLRHRRLFKHHPSRSKLRSQ